MRINNDKLIKAIKQYTEGKISLGKSAELANLSVWKFLDVLKERKIPIRHNLDDIKSEIDRIVKEDVEWGLSNK